MNPRPGPQRRNRSRLMAKLLERIKAGIIASDNNRLRDWGCVALTPPVEVALAVAAVLDVDVIDAGASAQGTVVAVWNTLGEPLTMEVQVVEMMAWDSSTTLLSPETPQSVEPSRAVFLTMTTGSPSVTQTVRQPLFPTVVDLQATTSRSRFGFCRAVSGRGWRWPACCCGRPKPCCSTSRPTISISARSNG